MAVVYLTAILVVLSYVVYSYFTRNFSYWKKRNVVGPKPIPFFGNIIETALRKKNFAVTIQEIYNMYPKEKVVGIYTMTTPCLMIRDIDIIKAIFVKDFDSFKDRGLIFSKKGLGNNLFHADAETWSVLRSRFNGVFTPGKLKNMFPLFKERADVFMTHLDNIVRTSPEHDFLALTQKYTISTIFACAFGVDMDPFKTKEHEALKTVDRVCLTPTFALELDMMYPGIMQKLNLSIFPAMVSEFFNTLVTNIISQRNGKPSAREDLMDLILEMRQMKEVSGLKYLQGNEDRSVEITDEMIAAQFFVFYVGGYETSSITMAQLFYHLALQPEIQDKLRKEIDSVMKNNNGEITYESLKDMKYLEKAVAETLRMHPIVEPLQRRALVDYAIPGTDVVIKKGQLVYISTLGIHYDEQYYPDPEVFDPDRFDPELVRARHPCVYLPFGAGPRNCIGMRFASLQSRLGIAKMISKYRIETCEKTQRVQIHPNKIIAGPKDNIILRIVKRAE